ncbi:MAG: bleomycin resistance protein [Pseudomonadales bacterium]|nr:bleomycin resistance protein [Pseudomonadales bacterium]
MSNETRKAGDDEDEGQSMSSSVEVATDPTTAFEVFTQEVNCWWLQGPINFHDSSQTYEKRIEPEVGGRILEVRNLETGEGLELGRITIWEPGTRLAWDSSIDDVSTIVLFEPSANGTKVTVTARIPNGGANNGGTSWVGVTPLWFDRWIKLRDESDHKPMVMARLALAVNYENPVKAAKWLVDTFEFVPAGRIPDDEAESMGWIEFHIGNASLIVLGSAGGSRGDLVSHTPWVFVDDLDCQFELAKSKGAVIVQEIQTHGARTFVSADLEGNQWTFAQASPAMLQ